MASLADTSCFGPAQKGHRVGIQGMHSGGDHDDEDDDVEANQRVRGKRVRRSSTKRDVKQNAVDVLGHAQPVEFTARERRLYFSLLPRRAGVH
jgi:hypothetical protein